jgi:hypothetical protein
VPVADRRASGTYLIPLTDSVRARCHHAAGDTIGVDGFDELTRGSRPLGTRTLAGLDGPVRSLRVWAGEGVHAAMAWHPASVIFGRPVSLASAEVRAPLKGEDGAR